MCKMKIIEKHATTLPPISGNFSVFVVGQKIYITAGNKFYESIIEGDGIIGSWKLSTDILPASLVVDGHGRV